MWWGKYKLSCCHICFPPTLILELHCMLMCTSNKTDNYTWPAIFGEEAFFSVWVQGWRSGESTRLPPMWPGFDSQTRRHMWVEFVGYLLCTERFSPGTPVSPLLKNRRSFDLIYFHCSFQFTVSPISAPALERLDT